MPRAHGARADGGPRSWRWAPVPPLSAQPAGLVVTPLPDRDRAGGCGPDAPPVAPRNEPRGPELTCVDGVCTA